jgi:putative intracellular protease/amidase
MPTYSSEYRIELHVHGRDRHVLVVRDRVALVALLEELAAALSGAISILRVCLRHGADEAGKLAMFPWGHDEMHVVAHLGVRMNGNAVLFTSFARTREKEAVLSRIGKQASSVVASEDHVVRMIGNDDETSCLSRHVGFIGQGRRELRFRGVGSKCPLTLGFSRGSMSPMRIAVVLFEGVTALDAVGPYEVLQRLPEAEVSFVGHRRGEVRTDNGFLGLTVDRTFGDLLDPEIVVVPGGIGTRNMVRDAEILDWVRKAHETTLYTTSVCTGSLVLAAAGLLEGLKATTHFSARPLLTKYGAVASDERVVAEGKIITAAGVSSGIDMALHLAVRVEDAITAKALQLMIEYDPQPPHDAGALHKVDAAVLMRAQELAQDKN